MTQADASSLCDLIKLKMEVPTIDFLQLDWKIHYVSRK